MSKAINFIFFIIVLIFFLSTIRYYSSNTNIEKKDFNRTNINEVINKKIFDLPILNNDTSDVIKFSDGYTDKSYEKSSSFWNLLISI